MLPTCSRILAAFPRKRTITSCGSGYQLLCSLNDQSALVLMAVSAATPCRASALDLRINTTVSTSSGFYDEVPARLECGGGFDHLKLRALGCKGLSFAQGQPINPSRLAGALLDALGGSPERGSEE